MEIILLVQALEVLVDQVEEMVELEQLIRVIMEVLVILHPNLKEEVEEGVLVQ